VLDAPRRARAFFEALIAGNLDIGRPANVEIIFGRKPIRRIEHTNRYVLTHAGTAQ
jgi:hypothetical protein